MEQNKILASNKGVLELLQLPLPQIDKNEVLIEVDYSVLSVGTENTIRDDTSSKNIIKAAFKKIELVKELGLKRSLKTFEKVWSSYQPLGYSLVGKVKTVGENVLNLEKGDLVLATGAGKAIHSKYVAVPQIYTLKIDKLDKKFAFGGVMTIGVNAYIKSTAKIGDRVCIIGGGLIGELTASVFKFGGCNTEILDIDTQIISRLTTKFNTSTSMDGEYDIIVLCTNTDVTFNLAQKHIKYKGKIVVTGYGSLNIDRDLFESKQFNLFCTDAYGTFANNPMYELLVEDNLASEFNLGTARDSLYRSKFILENLKIDSYKLLDISDFKEIDEILSSKKYSTIMLKW